MKKILFLSTTLFGILLISNTVTAQNKTSRTYTLKKAEAKTSVAPSKTSNAKTVKKINKKVYKKKKVTNPIPAKKIAPSRKQTVLRKSKTSKA